VRDRLCVVATVLAEVERRLERLPTRSLSRHLRSRYKFHTPKTCVEFGERCAVDENLRESLRRGAAGVSQAFADLEPHETAIVLANYAEIFMLWAAKGGGERQPEAQVPRLVQCLLQELR